MQLHALVTRFPSVVLLRHFSFAQFRNVKLSTSYVPHYTQTTIIDYCSSYVKTRMRPYCPNLPFLGDVLQAMATFDS